MLKFLYGGWMHARFKFSNTQVKGTPEWVYQPNYSPRRRSTPNSCAPFVSTSWKIRLHSNHAATRCAHAVPNLPLYLTVRSTNVQFTGKMRLDFKSHRPTSWTRSIVWNFVVTTMRKGALQWQQWPHAMITSASSTNGSVVQIVEIFFVPGSATPTTPTHASSTWRSGWRTPTT